MNYNSISCNTIYASDLRARGVLRPEIFHEQRNHNSLILRKVQTIPPNLGQEVSRDLGSGVVGQSEGRGE